MHPDQRKGALMREPTPGTPYLDLRIPPRWAILSPDRPRDEARLNIIVSPGAGFGTGHHQTTRLSLQAIAALAPRHGQPWRMLDFGSGSGILSIGAAKLGATVEGVEIDPAAVAHARDNLALNGLADRVRFSTSLEGVDGPFELVVANILRSVLLDHAGDLVERLAPGGTLVLGGLVVTDVPEMSVRYSALLGGRRPEVYSLEDWRAMVWRTDQNP